MRITLQNRIGTAKAGTAKDYRSDAGNLNAAVSYAVKLAQKMKERMIVVQGNSYMQRVYHICKESDDVVSYNGGMRKETKVVVVEVSGECFYAMAN